MLSRAQIHLATGCRSAADQAITLAADETGQLLGARQHAVTQTSIADAFTPVVGGVTKVLSAELGR